MKRLESHREKKIKRNIFLIIVIIFLLIYFIFSYGIKILLGTSAFIANISNRNKPESSIVKKEDFFGSIDVVDIPTATNSSKIVISGQTVNYDKVEFYLDDKKVDEIAVVDSFDKEIDNLQEGDNEIFLLAKSSKSSSTQKTTKYHVLLKKEGPKLEITEPKDGSKTSNEELKISGKTDKEVIVEINNLPIVVNVLGEFQTSLKLQSGENKILITAQDIAGNIESKTITVTYEKD